MQLLAFRGRSGGWVGVWAFGIRTHSVKHSATAVFCTTPVEPTYSCHCTLSPPPLHRKEVLPTTLHEPDGFI